MAKNLSIKRIEQLDKSDMLHLLLDIPMQIKAAVDIAKKASILFEKRDFKNILFCGLGGSAIGMDLVRAYAYFESKISMTVCREYDIPGWVDKETLVFVASYSGDTEETLSTYEQAKAKGATILAISSNGKLKVNTQKDNVTFVEIPRGLPPRSSLGYLSIIPLCLLARLGFIKDKTQEINKVISTLEELRNNNLNPRIIEKENQSKYIANKIFNKFAIIYAPSVHFDVVGLRFRGQIAENSKALASSHVFPEMNHNEIVGWEHPKKLLKNLVVIMLRDRLSHPRVNKRMDITSEILKQEGVEVLEIYSKGEDLLSRMYSLIYIGDFVSFYLAILYGIDPTPVERVTYLKKQLAQS